MIIEFLLAVTLLELTPGPNMAYLASLALTRGRTAGLIACIGVACGLSVHAVVTVFGAGTLIQQYPWLYETLRWVGSCLSALPRMGGMAGKARHAGPACRSPVELGAPFHEGISIERVQSEIDFVFCFRSSDVH